MIDKKQRILKILKENGIMAKSKIASYIRSDLWLTERYLEVLEKEKKIVKVVYPNGTYWKLI